MSADFQAAIAAYTAICRHQNDPSVRSGFTGSRDPCDPQNLYPEPWLFTLSTVRASAALVVSITNLGDLADFVGKKQVKIRLTAMYWTIKCWEVTKSYESDPIYSKNKSLEVLEISFIFRLVR